MYIDMYNMAKTIMIADGVYNRLKSIKETENKSFSEVIRDIIEPSKKTGKELKVCLGILKDDKEYDKEWRETLKKGWDKWNKRYA